ncbi:MAG TPA: hypothetical protein VNO17_02975 [Actinomycetota bacterium]|nr:hypothetical protein [Actinomycetota bacterium]
MSGSKLASILSTVAALIIVIATFFQWWDIKFNGAMRLRRAARWVLVLVAALLGASLLVLLMSSDG